jgi:hypothetical protein
MMPVMPVMPVTRRTPSAWARRLGPLLIAMPLLAGAAPVDALTKEELQRQLAERDARIAELLRRVEALEQGRPAVPASVAPSPVPSPTPAAAVPTAPQARPEVVDEDPARAIERALVREGGLVLPRGAWEIEPQLRYVHRSSGGLRLSTQDGQPVLGDQVERQDTFEPSLALRVGLPWATQMEVRLPYVVERRTLATIGVAQQTERATGVGDLDIALTRQLLVERPRTPGVLGTLDYRSTTGGSAVAGGLAPGAGYPSLLAALTAVKRLDPMVFFGTLSHTRNFAFDQGSLRIDPGDATGMRVGAALAASPETSLRLAFDLARVGQLRAAEGAVAGSQLTIGVMEVGASTLLTPRMLLSVQAGIGLTRDAPDFRLTVALPVRF